MVENVNDLIKLRECIVLLIDKISRDISSESIKNANVLADAIVSHFIETQDKCIDEEELILGLHCSPLMYNPSKKDVLKGLGIRNEDFNYFEEHFDLINDAENLYCGFDPAFLGLDGSYKYYSYSTDLIKELQSRGFEVSLRDNELIIKCHISTLDKDVTDYELDTDKKSVLDVQNARIKSINLFKGIINKIETRVKNDILKDKNEVIYQIMETLAYKVIDNIDSDGVSFSFKVIQVNLNDFINSEYFNSECGINTDLSFVRKTVNSIIERNNLFYVNLNSRTLLVDLNALILELRNKDLVFYHDEDNLVKVSADIPSREEILKRKLNV